MPIKNGVDRNDHLEFACVNIPKKVSLLSWMSWGLFVRPHDYKPRRPGHKRDSDTKKTRTQRRPGHKRDSDTKETRTQRPLWIPVKDLLRKHIRTSRAAPGSSSSASITKNGWYHPWRKSVSFYLGILVPRQLGPFLVLFQ